MSTTSILQTMPYETSTSIELLVFDLDGTLIDSKKDLTKAVNFTLSQYGLPSLSKEVVEKYIGTSVTPLIESSFLEAGLDSVQEGIADFRRYYFDHLTDETQLFAGVREVLDHYRSVKKVILTNKSNQFIDPLLKKLDLNHDFIKAYSPESFGKRKPDPTSLIEISKEHSIPLQKTVMIGDTDIDILTGMRAGALTCGVLYGFGEEDSIVKLNPSYLVSNPLDLIGLFESSSATSLQRQF